MPLAAELRHILNPGVVVQATEVDSIVLRERPADMRVEVLGLPAAFIAIRTERIGHASRINDGSWKQICDYLLITESGDRTHAVFVELKKTQTEEEKPREQLRRSLPLLEYLRSVWEIESETPLGRQEISIHYSILFERASPRLAKQAVRADPTRPASEEEYKGLTIRTFVGTSVAFATLTGG